MKAILFADRKGSELQPLTRRTCVALLPIATKPLIEYTLEALWMAGIRQVFVVISPFADYLEHYLGNGERWGLEFEYILSRGEEEPANVLARLGAQLSDSEYLLIRGDVLHSLDIEEFITKAQEIDGQIVATINGAHTGISLLRQQTGPNPWQASNLIRFPYIPFIAKSQSENGQQITQNLLNGDDLQEMTQIPVNGRLSMLDSLKAFHQANIDVLMGHFPTLILPVRKINNQLQVGRCSKVPPNNKGIVGAFCHVHPQARLIEKVILSDNVTVKRHARLNNTVVLPSTYIGQSVELHHAIVWGNLLIPINNGTIKPIFDRRLLADLKIPVLYSQFVEVLNRALGVFMLLISIPLWPFALLAALLQNPRKPLQKIKLRGNLKKIEQEAVIQARDFTTFEWATSIAVLRHLPKLLTVITGQLRIVGVRPETPEQSEARTTHSEHFEAWERMRDYAPIGLIGPSQLTLPCHAPKEEFLIVEAHYARTRHFSTDILWLWRGFLAFFTKRAWKWNCEKG
jgi:mannose-1-phosphate guanylyltransferase / phosphomannomutase